MIELLVAGNLYFTLPLVLVAAAVIAVAGRAAVTIGTNRGDTSSGMRTLFHLGLFAFVFGLVSQGTSLYQMMGAIQEVGAVSPAIVAGGLRVSFIVPLFGLYIFAAALLLRFVLELWAKRINAVDA